MTIKWINKMFNHFCQSTSLHGYGHLGGNGFYALKIVWIFVIIVMTGLGVYFVSINTMEFAKKKITTNIESSTTPLNVSTYCISMFILQVH